MRRWIPSSARYHQKTSWIRSVGRRIPSFCSRRPSVFSWIPSDFSRIPSELYQKRRAGYHQFNFFESCVGGVQTDGMRRRRIPSVRQAWAGPLVPGECRRAPWPSANAAGPLGPKKPGKIAKSARVFPRPPVGTETDEKMPYIYIYV